MVLVVQFSAGVRSERNGVRSDGDNIVKSNFRPSADTYHFLLLKM